ncbi:hypothetical protein NVP1205O_33 [Vibrio phage 1.205.O._10N.222.51.A7]|nr:hypothetical protein NVP1205O_33 [Vibrio phage 1.205.O._10N.222.51.A7]
MKLNDILNKDDRALFGVCSRVYGADFAAIKKEALQAAADAARSAPEVKKVNLARRAINIVLIEALKRRGVNSWRECLEK